MADEMLLEDKSKDLGRFLRTDGRGVCCHDSQQGPKQRHRMLWLK